MSAVATKTPIEALNIAVEATEMLYGVERWVTDARAALEDVEALLKELGEMPCWSPYEGAYFTGCDNRLPPRMDSHSSFTDDERCRRCTALAKFQTQQ